LVRAAQLLGLALATIGFALSILSLVFLTKCAGFSRCGLLFHWETLMPGLALLAIGTGMTILWREKRKRMSRDPESD